MKFKQTFDEVVEKLSVIKDKNANKLEMISIIVSNENETYSHYFKETNPVDIRSIAKPIACLALGAALDKGLEIEGTKLSIKTKIWPYISKYVSLSNKINERSLNEISILDCLKITLGHKDGIMFSADVKGKDEFDLMNYVVNYPITQNVGSHFQYSNAGTFILSSLISEYFDMSLSDLVNEHIFKPLSIKEFNWRKFGKYTCGCTGLKIQNMDLHKIGKLLLNNGMYNSTQVVPAEWVKLMTSPQVKSPTHRFKKERAFPKWSYGLNLWITEDGTYYCDGTNSQYLIVIPSKRLVISTTGLQKDSEPVSSTLGLFK